MHSSSAAVWVGWVVSTSGRAPRSFATFDGEFLTAFLEVVVATGWEISDRFCCLNAGSGRPFFELLDSNGIVYRCACCHAHLGITDELVSRQFHSKSGKAYLFSRAANVYTGEKEERMMTTGLHVVVDLFCIGCSNPVGWKYEKAYETSQKYKEGKFILERACVERAPVDLDSSDLSGSSLTTSDGCSDSDDE
eukprot:gene27651-7290_t